MQVLTASNPVDPAVPADRSSHRCWRGIRRALPAGLALAGILSSCTSIPRDSAPATPQRPTFSSDTSTTSLGTFELEAGGLWDPSDQIDTPMTMKYGFGETTEVFLGWSPLLYLDTMTGGETGVGDVFFGTRHRFMEETDEMPSAAFQTSIKLPTADDREGLGSGELDASFAGILSKNFERVAVTGYYNLEVIGDPTGGNDIAHGLALATSTPLSGNMGAFGELAGVFIPEQDDEQVFTTLGVTYSPLASMVFDFGVVIGLSDDAPDFQLVVGMTRNFGHY